MGWKGKGTNLFDLLICLISVLIFSFGSYYYLRILFRGIASESWPQTEGSVISSCIYRKAEFFGTYHYAKVTFSYSVGQEKFESSFYDIHLRPKSFANKAEAIAYLRNFPIGRKLPVYYDPNQPSTGVLEKGLPKGRKVGCVIMGLVDLDLASLIAWLFVRSLKSRMSRLL